MTCQKTETQSRCRAIHRYLDQIKIGQSCRSTWSDYVLLIKINNSSRKLDVVFAVVSSDT